MTAKFGKGYLKQAFSRLAVRAGLLHGEDNLPFLQRSDHALVGTGKKSVARKRVAGPHESVRVKIEQETQCA